MSNWIKELKTWIQTHRLIHQDTVVGGVKANTTQEDPRTINAIKSVGIAFEQQAEALSTRALKSHRIDCDNWNCKNDTCFIQEPDKTVKDGEYVIKVKNNKKVSEKKVKKNELV